MFKKSAVVIILSMLSSLSFASPPGLSDMETINIVRIKLWYDGIETVNPYNQALEMGQKARVQLPEELEVALEKLDS